VFHPVHFSLFSITDVSLKDLYFLSSEIFLSVWIICIKFLTHERVYAKYPRAGQEKIISFKGCKKEKKVVL
jgi:hypothetical protein